MRYAELKRCDERTNTEITLNIPDELARQVIPDGQDPARMALEALAVDCYRTELLSESAVRQMLGFAMRMEAHEPSKQHRVHMPYDAIDLERDRVPTRKARENSRTSWRMFVRFAAWIRRGLANGVARDC